MQCALLRVTYNLLTRGGVNGGGVALPFFALKGAGGGGGAFEDEIITIKKAPFILELKRNPIRLLRFPVCCGRAVCPLPLSPNTRHLRG